MRNQEKTWDKLLQIHTTGRDETKADQYHHPYEPTPYSVLERLAAAGMIGAGETICKLAEGGAVAVVGIIGMIAVLLRNELDD